MRSFNLALLALASLAEAGTRTFTGKGAILLDNDGFPAGCLNENGLWVREGPNGENCAIFTSNVRRVREGVDGKDPFKIWADRKSTRGCQVLNGAFFCSPDVDNPQEFHRNREYPSALANPVNGSDIWYAAAKPAPGKPQALQVEPPSDDAIPLGSSWYHSYA